MRFPVGRTPAGQDPQQFPPSHWPVAQSLHHGGEISRGKRCGRCILAFQVLTQNSYAASLVTDATGDGKVIHANKAFETLTGYDPHEVIGKAP